MLNQIEKQFNEFMVAMYGKTTISEAQEKDIEKSFYAGMFVAHRLITSLDENEETALSQLDELTNQIINKMDELINVQ